MGRRRGKPVFAPRERDIQAAVLSHWLVFGVPGSLVAAIPNAFAHGQAGLTPGLPDLMVISPTLGRITGYIELKADDGRLSEGQLAVRAFLAMRDIPYALTHGRDQPIRVLEEWGAVKPQAVAA
jgi:hypothetical protein